MKCMKIPPRLEVQRLATWLNPPVVSCSSKDPGLAFQ